MHHLFPLPARTNAAFLLCFLLKCSLRPSKAHEQSCHQLRRGGTGGAATVQGLQRGGTQGFAGSAAGVLEVCHCPSPPVLTPQGLVVFWVLQTPQEHCRAPGSGPVAGPVVSSCGFVLPEGSGVFQGYCMQRARHEDLISASTFSLRMYLCCTKGKLSLRPAVKGGTHGFYTQALISRSLAVFSSILED